MKSKRPLIFVLCPVVLCLALYLFVNYPRDRLLDLRSKTSGRRDIILITVDTLRSSNLGVYGYGRATSPNIDEFARTATVFENAFSPVPKTSPSLVSILSGLPPHLHGVIDLQMSMDPEMPFLPQLLQQNGYDTAGFCSQANCHSVLGLNRGFDYFDDKHILEPYSKDPQMALSGGVFHAGVERRAQDLVDSALAWIEPRRNGPKPFFVWIHLMDPHAGYFPPEPHLSFFKDPSPLSANSILGEQIPIELIHPQALYQGNTSFSFYANRYDGEIRYVDSELGRLFGSLKNWNLFDQSTIALTSDHGEYMGEVSKDLPTFNHGIVLNDGELRVPLIVKAPYQKDLALSKRLVSIGSVGPSLASIVDSKLGTYPPLAIGQDIPATDFVVAQMPQLQSTFMFRTSRYKLIIRSSQTMALLVEQYISQKTYPVLELYDLSEDPLERTNITNEHVPLAHSFFKQLADWFMYTNRHQHFSSAIIRDQKAIDAIKSLGYLH